MWNLIQELYRLFVYQPQLNLLYFFFKITGDIGFSIILLSTTANLIIFPLFAKNYLSLQKTRILQPKIKEIQDKYRKDPQKILSEMRVFNKKHGISTGYTFLVLFIQIFFISGLFFVISDAVQGKNQEFLYELFFNTRIPDFTSAGAKAFGFIEIGGKSTDYLWIPILSAVLSYLYGMYSFKWSPKPELPKLKTTPKPKKKKDDDVPVIDQEAIRKQQESMMIYMQPAMIFIFTYSSLPGIGIYFAWSSFLSLARQIFLTRYYTSHTDKLIRDIADSDPTSKDDNPYNNLEITGDPAQLASSMPKTEIVVEAKQDVLKKPKNSGKKKKSKK
jgi:YidC/Oxa1 family membrane protein insertase